MSFRKFRHLRKKAVKTFRHLRKKAVKTFLRWKDKFLDFLAYFMIKCLRKLSIKLPNFIGRSFFGLASKYIEMIFVQKEPKPKRLRAKSRLRDDFIKKDLYPDPEYILKNSVAFRNIMNTRYY